MHVNLPSLWDQVLCRVGNVHRAGDEDLAPNTQCCQALGGRCTTKDLKPLNSSFLTVSSTGFLLSSSRPLLTQCISYCHSVTTLSLALLLWHLPDHSSPTDLVEFFLHHLLHVDCFLSWSIKTVTLPLPHSCSRPVSWMACERSQMSWFSKAPTQDEVWGTPYSPFLHSLTSASKKFSYQNVCSLPTYQCGWALLRHDDNSDSPL